MLKMPLPRGGGGGEGRRGEVGKDVCDPEPPRDSPGLLPPPVLTPTDTDPAALLCYVTESRFQHVRL